MSKKRRDRHTRPPSSKPPVQVNTVTLMLAMVCLTLSGLLYSIYVLVKRTTTEKVSADPAIFAGLLTWIGVAALTWYVVAVLRLHRRAHTTPWINKVLLVLGACGFVAAGVSVTIDPSWVAWAIAYGASVFTGTAVARIRRGRFFEGLLLGMLLAMVGVVVEAMLRIRR